MIAGRSPYMEIECLSPEFEKGEEERNIKFIVIVEKDPGGESTLSSRSN